MGYFQSKVTNYGVYIGDKKEGETRIIRHSLIGDKKLPEEPFEGINNIWAAFEYGIKNNPNKNFLGSRYQNDKGEFGNYVFKTYIEVKDIVLNFASGIECLKFCPEVEFSNGLTKDFLSNKESSTYRFLGIYSKNREEWIFSDFACHALGITCVTFYDTLGDDTISFILKQTFLTTIVMEIENLSKIVKLGKTKELYGLKNIVLMESEKTVKVEEMINLFEEAKKYDLKILFFENVIKEGKLNRKFFKLNPSKPDTIATFCYTSGTTGIPKGAMLSHRAIIADCAAMIHSDAQIISSDIHISYLPLAHVLERVFFTACVINSASIGFYQGVHLKMIEDAQLLKPTIFIGVPRVFQRVVEKIKERIKEKNFINRNLVLKAISDKTYNYENYGTLHHFLWDRLIFKNMRNALGGNVRLLGSGSAPLSKEIQTFMKICFSCPMIEGYGTTECSGAATYTSLTDFKADSVGGVICSIEMKLIDVDEMNYYTSSKINNSSTILEVKDQDIFNPTGEILLRGPSLFSGYFLDEENTKKALDKDGWLHTGDIGMILPNMALKIIDRRKNIFKVAAGEYIAPEKIENILINHDFISQIFVYGEPIESEIIAIIVPNLSISIEFLKSKGNKEVLNNELIKDPFYLEKVFNNSELKLFLLKEINSFSRKNGLKGFEIPKNIWFVNQPFTVDNNLLTPSMKLKRHEAKKKFEVYIKQLYNEIHS